MSISRRDTLILAAAATAASVAGLAPARADDAVTIDPAKLMAPAGLPDHVIGNKDAKVTVIEYGSATCPHCGRIHHDVYPAFKTKYIDSGKIKFIFRPFALNVFDVVVFMLPRLPVRTIITKSSTPSTTTRKSGCRRTSQRMRSKPLRCSSVLPRIVSSKP